MEVYIETVLLNNLTLNFLLLYAVDKVLKLKAKKRRLLLADIVGTAGATVLPLFQLPQFVSVPVKILLSIAMVLVFYRFKNFKKFLAVWFAFLAVTFLAGGILVGLFYILQKDFAITDDLSIVSGVSFAVWIAGGLAAFVLIKNLTAYIYRKNTTHKNEYEVGVVLSGKHFALKGYFDSGNLLTDDATGLPVLVVTTPILKNAALEQVCADQKPHYLSYSTVAGGGKMLIVSPEEVTVNGVTVEAVLGVPCGKTSSSEFDILLNGKMTVPDK